jgi:hypothetical protein
MKRIHALAVLVLACLSPAVAWPEVVGEPIFAGSWSKKDPAAGGAFYYDQTWDQLVSHWKELGRQNQYLADVAAYQRNGEWRYAGLWRIGTGNGALLLAPWNDFIKTWKELQDTQELIDLEMVGADDSWRFLGVWRVRPPERRQTQGTGKGSGGLLVGLTWDQLVAKRTELGGEQYLANVKTYVSGGKRLFAGAWRVGPGNGALYWLKDWSQFVEQKRRLDATQELVDFEMFQTGDGEWNFIGVWRVSARSGPLEASHDDKAFKPLTADQLVDKWKARMQTATLTGLTVVNPMPMLRADTTCKYGDPDCNPCAADVPNQFRMAFEGGHRPWIGWHDHSWDFHNDRYPPDDRKPEDAFHPYGEGKQVGLPAKHLQGLVRTNSSRFPYAGSHSHKDRGSIFFVRSDEGKKTLHALYRSSVDHPSGVAVLGDGLFVAEKGNLRWFRVSDAGKPQSNAYSVDEMGTAGGGLGLAKLRDGTTLLIVSGPGSGFRKESAARQDFFDLIGIEDKHEEDNIKPRYTRFYWIVPNVFAPGPNGVQLIGTWKHEGVVARPDKPLGYSENLSVVTECGSGAIYTIHTTGDYAMHGDGYWRLSRMDRGPGGLRLVHLGIARQSQEWEKCHHRSSATVHVDARGKLEFLCSERHVIKFNPGKFDFKEGTF